MQLDSIELGTVIKIWGHPKGHDYVVAGEDLQKKELLLIKNNCLNTNGTIHASTTRFHKKLSYEKIGNNRVVSGVTRILGQRSDTRLCDFSRLLSHGQRSLPVNRKFVTSAQQNNFNSVLY